MNLFLTLAFLFFIGSVLGWVLELFFRRFISSANPERKWINPGFCTGPWLPLYGSGLCILFLIANLENMTFITDPVWERAALFAAMAREREARDAVHATPRSVPDDDLGEAKVCCDEPKKDSGMELGKALLFPYLLAIPSLYAKTGRSHSQKTARSLTD